MLYYCSFDELIVYVSVQTPGLVKNRQYPGPYLTDFQGYFYMKLFVQPVDLTSVSTIIYHLPDGPSLSLNIDGIEEYVDLELEVGHYCDTSDIDGTLHFFPKGNA